MKLMELFFGTLMGITERKEGRSYPETDWRMRYVGCPGLIAVYESEYRAVGQKFVYFYPDDPDNQMQDWIRTSAGDLHAMDDEYVLMSRNSKYSFKKDDGALPEERKLLMYLNLGMQPDDLKTQNF